MLKFSEKHGDAITLSEDRTVAVWTQSRASNLILSEHPMKIGQPFTFRCLGFDFVINFISLLSDIDILNMQYVYWIKFNSV